MQPVLRKVRELLRADLRQPQGQRLQPSVRRFVSVLMVVSVVLATVAISVLPSATSAANTNVLANGGFESGFSSQPGCGSVGNGWNCFTNGGAVHYAYHDDQWGPTVFEGSHSQLISFSTKGISQADADRYAGIYQTVRVVDWQEYTLNLRGLIRTTRLEGDPHRYTVQVGYTFGPHPNWAAVSNWQDVGWYTYFERESPGPFSEYAQTLKAEDDWVTVYVRIWKKWGNPEVELNVNLDGISLVGPSPTLSLPANTGGLVESSTYPSASTSTSAVASAAAPQQAVAESASCSTFEFIYNGGFEGGFNAVSAGNVGKGWGFFTNGGAANFSFHQDQWSRVVADGASSQLIEINTKGRWPADGDRFAGIYQHIGRLTPGVTYELSLRGLLRGDGPNDDPYRFEAQWGFNAFGNTDWTKVTNWQGMDLGPITARTEPGPMATYRARFVAPSSSVVLFIRGWSKWPTPEQEMNFNVDALSLKACSGGVTPPPSTDPGIPIPPGSCLYIVRPGDTLGSIARRFNTTVWALAQSNRIPNVNIIYVGQHLNVPGCTTVQPPEPPKPPQQVRIHVVRAGETLSQIAKKYGLTTSFLAHFNGIRNPNLIFVGQRLKIP